MTMPQIILVTGTDTGVGKTITTAALAAVLHRLGRSVAVYKPCQSGASAGDSDTAEIVRLAGTVTAETGVVLQEPLAPVAAAAVDGTPLPRVAAHAGRVRELAASHDHVLVEGAGGLLVELDSDGGTLAELGALLAAAFVLVARPALGTLNHTALTLEALGARELQVLGVVVGSWPRNPDFVHHSNRTVLGSLRVPFLGAIPEQASELSPAAFRAKAAEWLNGLPGMKATSAQARCPYLVVRDPDVVREVLHRPGDFSPANALIAVTPLAGPALRVLQRVHFALPPVLASNDTDTHAGIRKVVAGYFTPAKVAAMQPRIRELAQEAAGNAAEQLNRPGHVDLVHSVAAFPPAIIMLELLGLPVRDLAALKRWGLDSMELFWGWPDETRQLELAHSAANFYVWLRQLVTESTDAPGRNLFKSLAEHGLSRPEICSLGYFLLIAGQETTTQLISTTLFRLLQGSAPMDWKDAASEAGSRSMVRHVLATESSVPTWRRVAAHDTRLGGELVPAGAEILLELTGNHVTAPVEPEGLPLPMRVDGHRPSTAYGLVFGSGIHRCLGAKLAELEAAIIVHETASALPGIQLRDRDPEWIRLLSFQAPRRVTVCSPSGL